MTTAEYFSDFPKENGKQQRRDASDPFNATNSEGLVKGCRHSQFQKETIVAISYQVLVGGLQDF